ncbi:unnamed protein product [Ixodes pacificus]
MRVLVALAFVAAVAAAVEVPQVLPELLFEPNQEYLYKYRTAVSLSLPLKATHATGEETYGLLSVVVKEASGTGRSLVLQLLNVTSTLYDKEVEDQTEPVPGVYHQPLPVFESYQTGPVVLKLVDHSVESLEVPVGVPEEVVNLYRGLASVLTLSNPSYKKVPFTKEVPLALKDDVVVYKVYEDDLVGTCETVYNVLSSPHDEYVLNFTKTKNYHKCVGKTTVFQHVDYEHSGCPHACLKHQPKALSETLEPELSDYVDPYGGGCPTETHLKNDLAESFLTVHYNVSLHQEVGVLEEVKAVDKKVLTSGKQQLVSTSVLHLELLLKTTPFTAVGPLEDVKTYTNLSYVYPEQHYSWHGQLFELEHLSLYGPVDVVEARTAVRGLLDQLAGLLVLDDLEVKDDYADLVSQLLTTVNVLKEYDLELLLQTVVPLENVKVVSEKEYIERKLLLDVLSLAGTDAAAKTVLRLLLEQKLTLVEAVHVLTSLQTSLVKPSTEVLDLLLDLATSGVLEKDRLLYSTAYLTLAKVVSKHCHLYDTTSHVPYGKLLRMNDLDTIKKKALPYQPTYRSMKTYRPHISGRQYQEPETEEPQYTGVPVTCTSQDYLKYVQALVQKLNEAKEFHQVTVLVHALTQLQHPEALKALVPVVLGKHHLCQATLPEEEQSESCQYLRLVTLYALRHSLKHHAAELQTLAQTVYFNTDEDYELRNAALVLLMGSHPPEPVLARVVLTLQKELNLQVASFTYSTLFAYANATVPCTVPTAVRVKKLLPALWHKKFGVQYSKFNFLSTYSQTDDFGVHAYHSYVQSNKTVLPRALLFGVEFTKGPYVSHLFDVTAVSKGLETLGKYLLRHEGPVTVFAEAFQRVRRQIFDKYETYEPLSQLLDVLEKQFNFDTTTVVDEPKLSLSTSFLGTELYLPVDKYFLGELLSKGAQYVSENWVHPVNMRYLQLRLPYTYRKLVPSVVGLPVALTTRYPTILSVAVKDFKLRYQPHPKTWLPSVLALSTFVQPSVYTSAVSSVVTVTPFTKVVAGVRTLAKTRLTLPYDVAFQYSSVNHTVALTVRPRYTKFFTHHTKSVTYTTPAVLYTPPQRAVMATMSVLYSQAKPFEFKKTFGHEALGLGLHVQGLSSHPDLHVPFSFQRYTKEKGLLGAFVDVLTNPWHVARKWEARVVRSTVHPVDEYKLTFRWKTTLNQTDRADLVEEVLPALYQSTKYPTTRYGYPEDLETPIYEEHYKRAVGELPPYLDFYQVLQEVVAATEVTSTPLGHYVTPFLNDVQNTTYGYFVEFVLGALGPLEPKVLTGHALLGHTFDKALKLSQLYVNKVNSPYQVKVHSALLKTAVPSPFKSYAVDKKEQSLYFTSVVDVQTEESDSQKYTLQVEVVPTEEQLYGVKTHPSHYAHPSHLSHPKNIKKQMRKSKFSTLEHTEEYLVPWYYKQCEKDVQEGKELVSAACKKVYLREHVLNKVLFKVTVPEVVPGLLKNVTHSLLQYAKVLFYNKLVTDYDVETRSTFTHLEGELLFEDHLTGKTTANLTLYTPLEEKLQFVRLSWPKYLKPTVAVGFLDMVAGVLRRSYPTPTCLVSPTYLKTFDNVTVLLKPYLRDDTYVVARHVLDEPDFYVLTEFQGDTQLVKLVLRNQTLLELTPPKDSKTFEVLVNGTSLYVEPLKSHVLQYTLNYTSQVFLYVTEHQEVGPTLWVTVRDLGLKFAYDGSKLIFKVLSPKYKGRVLGLCGDLDGEYVDELVTPELCVLTEEEDFVQTYSLKGLESTVGLYKCPLGVTLRGVGAPSYPRIQKTFARINPIEAEKEIELPKLIDTPDCVTERRKTIYKDGKVCISTKKVTACQRRCKPVATEKVNLEFVCLNEKHPVAKRLLKDIQGKRNVRLPADIPTFNEDVEVPTDCVPEV